MIRALLEAYLAVGLFLAGGVYYQEATDPTLPTRSAHLSALLTLLLWPLVAGLIVVICLSPRPAGESTTDHEGI